MKKFILFFVVLLSLSVFAQEGYQPNRNVYDIPIIIKTGPGGSSSDSSFYFKASSGAPYLYWYGTDGDNFGIGINTSDEMLLTGMAALNVPTAIAGIDSFTLLVATDTLVISGVAAGDIFTFAEYTPSHSTAIDTVSFSYRCTTDTVFVSRTTAAISGAAYKSAGIYSYIRLK